MAQIPVAKMAAKRKAGRPEGLSAEKEAQLSVQESRNELFRGVSMSDMCILFRMDRRTIMQRIGDVPACGERRGASIWQIRDVAPCLVRPAGDIEDHIRRMRPNDLPPLLSKEFWNGQRSKLRYLEETGQLWRTDRILGVLAEVFKTIRMNLLLVPDALERKTTLSDQQREEVRLAIDGTLEEMRDALIGQFEGDVEDAGFEDHTAIEGAANDFDGEFGADEDEDDEFFVPDRTEPDYGDL